jgi:two-component system, NarL family, sensor histidine kinase DesK
MMLPKDLGAMPTLTPVRLMRAVGVMACLLDAVFTIIHRLRSPTVPANLGDALFGVDFPFALLVATDLLSFAATLALCWYLMDERRMVTPARRSIWLLILQTLVSLMISPSLTYLCSAQAGFLLRLRAGMVWVMGQVALNILVVVGYPEMGEIQMPVYLQNLQPWQLMLGVGISTLVYHLLAFGLGYLAAEAVRQRLALARRNAELEATQQIEADSARLAERLTIARDLHDEVGHHLTALSLHLQLATRQTSGEAHSTVEQAYLLVRTVLSDIRNTVTDLRSAQAVDLPRALQTLVGGLKSPRIHLRFGAGVKEIDPLPSHALFRSAQELITNAVRHSGARNLWLELSATPLAWTLLARDDGRGAENLVRGNGINGMVERIHSLGGRIEFSQRGGLRVDITLPRKQKEPA